MENSINISPDLLLQENSASQLAARVQKTGKQLTEAEHQKIKKVSKDFEAMFVGMMLKSMRDTVPEDKLTGGGRAEETFQYLLDQEYATLAAERGGSNSLSAMIEKELLKRYQQPVTKPATDSGQEN
jgi:flagellar protein FlgJ